MTTSAPPARSGPLVLVALGVALWAAVAAPTRATYGARTTADEPQYLLSAISLVEDGDLTISDELAEERWRAFHEAQLPVQTQPLPDGREVSPHNPLLPAVLAPGVAAASAVGAPAWLGAKLTLAVLAGALAALCVWTAERRFGVARTTAVVVVLTGAASAPLVSYGTQLYPELPAAFAVAVGVAAATGDLRHTRSLLAFGAAVVALPWLSVKYAPVAAALALPGLWAVLVARGRAVAVAAAAGLAAMGALYAAAHLALYTGLTPYAAGDHFVGGELDVMGSDPDHLSRTIRLLGLLVDHDFGLVAWAPVWALAVPALVALARRRPSGWVLLALPLAAGWATATWVALTMHGWWWPGRQVVVVLPCAVLALAWWADRVRGVRALVAVAGVVGALTWGWLVAEVLRDELRLIIDFADTGAPWFRAVHPLLPDGRDITATGQRFVVWGGVCAALAAWGWVSVGGDPRAGRGPASARRDEDAGARERSDADVAAVDLDGHRAVG